MEYLGHTWDFLHFGNLRAAIKLNSKVTPQRLAKPQRKPKYSTKITQKLIKNLKLPRKSPVQPSRPIPNLGIISSG